MVYMLGRRHMMKLVVGSDGMTNRSRLALLKSNVTALLAGKDLEAVRARHVEGLLLPGRLPTLVDPSSNNFAVFGNQAICRYMCGGQLGSGDGQVNEWLEYDEKELENCYIDATTLPSNLETKLNGKKYLGPKDEVGLADVFVGCTLNLARGGGIKLGPVASKWLDDILSKHPEFQKGLNKTERDLALCFSYVDNKDSQMASVMGVVEEICADALQNVASRLKVPCPKVMVTEGSAKGKGVAAEFQMNNAMSLFKDAKDSNPDLKSPRDVGLILAEEVQKHPATKDVFKKVDAAGPGFVNLFVSEKFVSKRIQAILRDGKLLPPFTVKRTVGVDFSSPNVAKEMHVGHLRSTIIGEVLCRMFEFTGHNVKRINHVGDWGTQFGMLLTYMRHNYPDFLENPPTIEDLGAFYKSAKRAFDASEEFKEESRLEVVKLQSGDRAAMAGWKQFLEISESMFQQVYERLGVTFPDGVCGESFYNSRIPATVKELEDAGLITLDDGAKVIKTSAGPVPLFIVKRDGGFGYDSTDMTAIKYRVQELGLDWIIYVTDSGQSLHFMSCFEAADRAGWVKDVDLVHVGFGIVQGEDKKRFRTRSGETVRLVDLLDEAKRRMVEDLRDRLSRNETSVKAEDIESVASKIGYSAIKYADLSNKRENDYVFNYDLMLQKEGNTGVYLIYSYARICSIEAKVEESINRSCFDIYNKNLGTIAIDPNNVSEFQLALAVIKFTDYFELAALELKPHHLCKYAYELAVAFARFYTNNKILNPSKEDPEKRVLNPENGERWLTLVHCVKIALQDTFKLLSIDTIERI